MLFSVLSHLVEHGARRFPFSLIKALRVALVLRESV